MALPTLVIDDGLWRTKVGFSTSLEPLLIQSVGDVKIPPRQGFTIESRIRVWETALAKLEKSAPSEHQVLFSIKPEDSSSDRKKLQEIWFEQFNTPSLHLGVDSVLSLASSGRTSGCVVDFGADSCRVSSILDGVLYPETIKWSHVGGISLTSYLAKMVSEVGLSYAPSYTRDQYLQIKEGHCYVALDFDNEMQSPRDYNCLIDDQHITLLSERFRVAEPLFQPSFLGTECLGIHELVFNSILKAPHPRRSQLLHNIVLGGAAAAFPGMAPRLNKELHQLSCMLPTPYINTALDLFSEEKLNLFSKIPIEMRNVVKKYCRYEKCSEVTVLDKPNIATWLGGALLAPQVPFTSKEEYHEKG